MDEKSTYIETYRIETEELLAEVEEAVLEIEENPEDNAAVNRLFRVMHTIKGSGGMFGFDDIADFTHHVETVLDKVRNGIVPVTKELIDLVLASQDQISAMLADAAGGPEADIEERQKIISRLNTLLPESRKNPDVSPLQPETALPEEDGEKKETTYRIRFRPDADIFTAGTNPVSLLSDLQELGESTVVAQTSKIPSLDKLNPENCCIFWDIILTTSQGINAIKDVFIFVEDNCELSIDIIDDADCRDDNSENMRLGEILLEREDLSKEGLTRVLEGQKPIGEMLVEAEAIDRPAVESSLAEQNQVKKVRQKRQNITEASSIRVAADKLDSLVNLVGEMVTAQARLSQKAASQEDPELLAIAEEVEQLTSGLRDNTMSIRMLAIGTTFTSFKRLVRDLSSELNKDVEMTTIGGETELDKTVIERLKDPLVHIVRNSIDHGIESPEVRKSEGKPVRGTITLSAEHSGAHVLINISDDGNGLDSDAIHEKAIEKGIITTEVELSEREIFQLVCAPGFSTAKTVTDLSGRGVGMDVVKRNIEALRGSIDISSKKGVGTTITLKLPLTLAIIDGLMVTLGKDYYILPLASVEECVALDRKEADKIKGRNIMNVRGEAVPYVRLREKFAIQAEAAALEQIVITEINGERVGFVVDNVIGGHQTVIKSLGPAFKEARDVSGATILGDGTVALILDVNRLV